MSHTCASLPSCSTLRPTHPHPHPAAARLLGNYQPCIWRSASLLPDLKHRSPCTSSAFSSFAPIHPLPSPTATHTPGTDKPYGCLAILRAELKYLPSNSRLSQQTLPLSLVAQAQSVGSSSGIP